MVGLSLAVGHFGGPQQHPAPGQDPQPCPGGTEADIQQNTVANKNMICHCASPQIRDLAGQRSQVLPVHAEGLVWQRSDRNTWRRKDEPKRRRTPAHEYAWWTRELGRKSTAEDRR